MYADFKPCGLYLSRDFEELLPAAGEKLFLRFVMARPLHPSPEVDGPETSALGEGYPLVDRCRLHRRLQIRVAVAFRPEREGAAKSVVRNARILRHRPEFAQHLAAGSCREREAQTFERSFGVNPHAAAAVDRHCKRQIVRAQADAGSVVGKHVGVNAQIVRADRSQIAEAEFPGAIQIVALADGENPSSGEWLDGEAYPR